jgi:hypothetical protein
MDFKQGVEHAPSATGRPSKKIPAPYSRARIEIGGTKPEDKREWHWISAFDLAEQDIIAGEGVVLEIKTHHQYGAEWRMYLRTPRNPHGTIVEATKQYYTFTKLKKSV